MPDDTDGSRQRPRVQPDATLPPDAPLTKLGELFEAARLRSGMTTEAFLRAHSMARRTWWRLLYGPLNKQDKAPAATTIVQYARAAGVNERNALALAKALFDLQPARPLTRLGAELERCRLETGEYTWPFLAKRNLTPSTWYRLLHGGTRPPKRETVYDYAVAVGLDADRALFLAGLQEENGTLGRRIAQDRAAKQPEEHTGMQMSPSGETPSEARPDPTVTS